MKALITLDEHSPAKIEIERAGACRTLYLPLQELVDVLISSTKEKVEEDKPAVLLSSPAFPTNTIKYMQWSNETDIVFLFHPEAKANVTYHKDVFEQVPFPPLVFCFGVRKNRLITHHVVACKDRVVRENTQLYQFPFSNVYAGGKMCYYDNEPIHDLVQLQSFAHNWLHAPFNDHLYHPGRSNLRNQPLREILETTQHQPFDYDMLRPMNRTFQQWTTSMS